MLSSNIEEIEEIFATGAIKLQSPGAEAAAPPVRVAVKLKLTGDFAGIRAIEGSLCGCSSQ
eukprot:611882-Pleurochrysis_carterae.AAC.1